MIQVRELTPPGSPNHACKKQTCFRQDLYFVRNGSLATIAWTSD